MIWIRGSGVWSGSRTTRACSNSRSALISWRSSCANWQGSTEVLQNTDEGLRKQQRDLYADLEKRLTALEGSLKAGAATGGVAGPAAPAAPDAQSAYNKAIEVLKSGDYAAAAQQLPIS